MKLLIHLIILYTLQTKLSSINVSDKLISNKQAIQTQRQVPLIPEKPSKDEEIITELKENINKLKEELAFSQNSLYEARKSGKSKDNCDGYRQGFGVPKCQVGPFSLVSFCSSIT